MLFADLFMKAGRPEDARQWLELATFIGVDDWRHRALIDDRLANFDDRLARFTDDDPSNDPRFAGTGPEACIYCHYE